MSLRSRVLSTMKSSDVEGNFELYVTRTPGYLWALFFRFLHVHPVVVTLLSIVIGSASAYFFYFDDLKMNLIGMFLLVWANWYDCADGQLARMTGKKTLIGRLLDGAAGDVWFWCIYWALAFRLTEQWGIWIYLLGAWAGLFAHARQCAIADYYRNIHLYFVATGSKSELEYSDEQHEVIRQLSWPRDWFQCIYRPLYYYYTRGQEKQSPKFQQLMHLLRTSYQGQLPEHLVPVFRAGSKPLMKWCNVLTFDTRVGVLFLSLIVGQPWIYPLFEVTVLEVVRFWMIRRHENLCAHLFDELKKESK